MDASWADQKWKKIIILKCHLLFFYVTTMNHFWIRLWCVTKSVFYPTTGGHQLGEWTEKKLQSTSQHQMCDKKGYSHYLVVCCQSDPLHLSEFQETIISEKYAQQIDEIHQLLQHLQPALVNRKGPILLHDNAQLHVTLMIKLLQKVNELGYKVLPHPPYSSDLSPINYHFLKHLDSFLQGKCSHN